MHIEYLYYFKDFSHTLSISKAAAKNYMTPQGLSRAIHQLEKDFGIRLTSYQDNEISLTPAGLELSKGVDSVLGEFERLKGVLQGYRLKEISEQQGVRGAVRVIITPCVSQYVATLLDLQKPGRFGFDVKFKESNLYRIIPHLEAREDEETLGLISIPVTEKYQNLLVKMCQEHDVMYEPLFRSPLMALVSMYSPLSKKKVVLPEDVRDYNVARYQDSVLGDALDDYILEERVKTVTNATSIIHTRILEDNAVSFAPKLIEATRFLHESIRVKPTEGFFDTEFGILIDKAEQSSGRIWEVIHYMESKVLAESRSSRYGGTFTITPDLKPAGQ